MSTSLITALSFSGLGALFVFLVGYTLLVPKNSRGFNPNNDKQSSDNSALKFFSGFTNELLLALPASDRYLKEPKQDKKIQSLLVRSGNPWGVTPSEYKTLRLAALFIAFILSIPVALVLKEYAPIPPFVIIALISFFGFYIPQSKHNDLAKKRDLEFKRQLPEALDLISIALSGGSSFTRAIQSSLPSMAPGIVKDEFQKISRDINSGTTLDMALESFADRAPNDSVKTFVRAVQTASKTNAPLAEILESRAKASRQEFFSYVHQKAAQLESKIWMILSPTMLPALMIITIMPSVVIMMEALG